MVAQERASEDPTAGYPYVETAVGGASNRNKVVRLDAFRPPPDTPDVYVTYLRYPRDLVEHVDTTRNDKGNPTVKGYAGPALAPVIPLDFDNADDLGAALADARAFCRRFCERYDVPPAALAIFFSGHKGFSIEIPATLFGGFEPGPAPDVTDRLKRLALALAEDLDTLDESIYEPVRLWRWPNTVNGKSGRRKIPLTFHELISLDIAAIVRLAEAPRHVERVPDDEWEAREDLAALWQMTAERPRRPTSVPPVRGGSRRLSVEDIDALIDAVEGSWQLGHKHDLGLCLAGFLARSGVGEDQALAIVEVL
ncbi:MAG: hypothetical protein M3Q10_04510, partial [Chloroflexota bacterium]|nr:hypothetical protein [Chloroflexota bacterium]